MDDELIKILKYIRLFGKLGQIPGYCPLGQLLSCTTAQACSGRRIQVKKENARKMQLN